jgi:hypothetical protein
VSRATATVTLIGLLFPPDEGLQLVHLHGAIAFLIARRVIGGIGRDSGRVRRHPVGDGLMHDAQEAADGAQAHPFEIQAYRLLVDDRAVPLLLRGGGEVAPAGEAAIALRARAVVPPSPDAAVCPAMRARRCIHAQQFRLPPPL